MPDNGFTYANERFDGPLEALLDLIEKRKMPISDVSLAQVADSYLAYVEKLPELPLAETSQFILVASTLLLIKSRSLLPTLDLTEEERESVEELERRLARYAIVRKAAKELRGAWHANPLLLAARTPERPTLFAPAESSVHTLYGAIKRLLHALPIPEKLAKASVAPIVALEEIVARLRTRFSLAVRTRFSEIRRGARDKGEVIVYFLGVLELVREGSVSVTQERLFEDITIEMEQAGVPRYGL
jgi:segregation and condensation protein A